HAARRATRPRRAARAPLEDARGRTLHPCAQAMGGSWSDEDIRRYADLFDCVIVGGSADRARVARFHQLHPGIVVLAYTGEFDVYNSSGLWTWIHAQHDDWFLRDAGGGHVRTYRTPNRYALDPGNAGVRAFFADSAARRIAELGCDGVWEDNVFPDWNYRSFAMGAKLARYASPTAWREALEGYLARLERSVAPHHLAVNQVKPWTGHGDIVVIEDLPAGEGWEDMVEGLARVNEQPGRTTMLLESLDNAQDPKRAFIAASYLLAAKPGAYLGFHWSGGRSGVGRVPEYDLELGRPAGAMSHADGVWWRDWDRARIAVNPGAEPRPAPGGGTLPPHSAGIAWRTSDHPALPDWVDLGARQ
ncbi:MAG TPA: putative glycoside hydrolase, partial [Candidatus Eisenbacteria bacterium]|nr:putative glycoside hydrolase [Candidatus Eisenbacteria bacterium]